MVSSSMSDDCNTSTSTSSTFRLSLCHRHVNLIRKGQPLCSPDTLCYSMSAAAETVAAAETPTPPPSPIPLRKRKNRKSLLLFPLHLMTMFSLITLTHLNFPMTTATTTSTTRLPYRNMRRCVTAFSTAPSNSNGSSDTNNNKKNKPDLSDIGDTTNADATLKTIAYKSRSTSTPDQSTLFAKNSGSRKERLDAALLSSFGIESFTLTDNIEFRGTAALRAYSSFLLPKSDGAFAVAESPQRAAVVANNIAFLVREHKSHRDEWLCNHDRCLQEVVPGEKQQQRQPLTLVLDNLRSAQNVGNILRAAEAARVTEVRLCGITPGPPNPKVLKTAVGAAEYVPHSNGFGSPTLNTIQELQKQGVFVVGVETTSKSTQLWKTTMPQPLALVFGNEVVGVDADILAACDGLVCVPTHGIKNSLNVATCASIVMWEALRQWDDMDGDTNDDCSTIDTDDILGKEDIRTSASRSKYHSD